MQRTYFLGGASSGGFETAFWAEQKDFYGFYLKGGPGTGKSTLMKKLAAAFAGENISLYHCASDPRSLDAVVFEERGVFVADTTAPHESSTPLPFITGELTDLAEGLNAAFLRERADEIRTLYAANQAAHGQAKKGIAGITAMQDQIAMTGHQALLGEKLSGYASRLAKRILPKGNGSPVPVRFRQSCALTPEGLLTLLPEEYSRVYLCDAWYAAAQTLLHMLAETAAGAGVKTEVTVSLTQTGRPYTHVILPEQKLALIAVPKAPADTGTDSVMQMQRFYDADMLRGQRALGRFCASTAARTEAQTVQLLSEALRIHDALEEHYIGALDTAFLDQKAASMITAILSHPKR